MCFDFNDGKESQEIMEKLSTKNKEAKLKEVDLFCENKRLIVCQVLENVYNHSKTKSHLGCLLDKGSQKAFKLPSLQKTPRKEIESYGR